MGKGSSTAEALAQSVSVLRRHLGDAGEARAGFAMSKRVFAHVITNNQTGSLIARLKDWSSMVYGDAELVPRCAVVGDPDECVAGLTPLVEQGLDLLLLDPIFDIPEQARLFREHVLPAFA